MNEPEFLVTLQRRVEHVEEHIANACARAGRSRDEVTIVAVTKTLTIAGVRLVAECGLRVLGESRPQDFWKKAAAVPDVEWHFIGHLQRNKIDQTLRLAKMIHSVDSVRLLEAIDAEAAKQNIAVSALLEVNASREASKHGFAPEKVLSLSATIRSLKNVRIDGLMTMAAPSPDPNDCRPTFSLVRELRERLRPLIAPLHPCQHLSMGMTNDYAIAIEEGATFVRLGSVFFEGIEM
jgi:pyridoxal phosphate enzyme (YggS family)